jgi:hypothetical protein
MFRRFGRLVVYCAVLVGCSLAATVAVAGPAPQILDLSYRPALFHAGSGIEVRPRMLDGADADVAFHCRWFVDGEEVEDLRDIRLPGDCFQRGDLVAVEVTPERGGQLGRPVRTGAVEAGNAPPRIVSQPPEGFSPGLFRYAVKAVDADDDGLLFSLQEGPPGMQLDSASGLLTWEIEKWQKGRIAVTVAVEDGFGGQDRQQFTMDLSFVEKAGQHNE